MNVKEYLKYPVKYDSMEAFILDAERKIIVDVRGFGKIQYLFKKEDGTLDMFKAEAFQDEIGVFIQDAINEQLLKQ